MLQSTTPRPTLHRSSQVLHRRSRLLHNNVCCLVYCTEAPKYYITKAPEFYTSMYAAPAYFTEAPHYYNTEALKYYTTTLRCPELLHLRPEVLLCVKGVVKKKKSCPNCLSVTNCIPHLVTDSPLWVNILIFTLSFVSIMFFFFLFVNMPVNISF
jgi:hypothetical protein